MQAARYLRMPDYSKKLHCFPTPHGSKHTLLNHHHQFNLAFSPHSCSSLQAGPSWRIRPIVHAHVYPPPDDATGNEKANGSRQKAAGQAARPVAAVVVLACALGAMCLSSKARACAGLPSDFLPSRPPSEQNEQSTSESQQQKSLEVLCDIFQKKTNCGNYPVAMKTGILEESYGGIADYKEVINFRLLETSKKGDAATKSLRDRWDKKGSAEKYELGLLLFDLLIHQGDYKEAGHVFKEIEEIAPPSASTSDARFQIRKAIVTFMLLIMDGEDYPTQKTKKTKKFAKAMHDLIKLIKENVPETYHNIMIE